MATQLDLESNVQGDLVVDAGDLVIVEDIDVVTQRLRSKLRTFKGEWYLDPTFGVDYFGAVFLKNPPRSLVESTFRNAIQSTPGVREVLTFQAAYDTALRKFTLTFSVNTDYGHAALEEQI